LPKQCAKYTVLHSYYTVTFENLIVKLAYTVF